MDPDDALRSSYEHAESCISQMYKATRAFTQETRNQGMNDAYQEIIQWMLARSHGDLRFVPVAELVEHLQRQLPSTGKTMTLHLDEGRRPADYQKKFKPDA